MDIQRPKPRLMLLTGGLSDEATLGPVTRLGLWNRFPGPSKTQVTLMVLGKLLLLAIALAIVLH